MREARRQVSSPAASVLSTTVPSAARFGTVIGRVRLSASITADLVQAIIGGSLEPGTSIPSEKELATAFDVSRQVVRDSTSQLVALGLIERRQGRISRVAPRDSWNQFAPEILAARQASGAADEMLLDLLEFRRMIEPEAAWLAARRRDDHDIALLRDHMGVMDRCVSEGARQEFIQTDLAFHEAILRSTKNELLPQLFGQLQVVLAFAREMSPYAKTDALALSQLGHQAILSAVVSGDADAARSAMVEHLSWTATLGNKRTATRRSTRSNASGGSSE